MTDQRADVAGWITPPADGGERLDGRSAALITADRVLTGRRGRAEGGLEVLGGADDAWMFTEWKTSKRLLTFSMEKEIWKKPK